MAEIKYIKHLREKEGKSIQAISDILDIDWRTSKKYAEVQENLVFSGESKRSVYFSDTTFTGKAHFSLSKFRESAYFEGALFTTDAYFDGTTFIMDAYFGGTRFTEYPNFAETTFAMDVYFEGATFIEEANFHRATFTGSAYFGLARFKVGAYFNQARFELGAYFNQARFTGDTNFEVVNFTGNTSFDKASFTGEINFVRAKFAGDTNLFTGTRFAGGTNLFIGARFTGDANFSYVTFKGITNFSDAIFEKSADFSGCSYSDEFATSLEYTMSFRNVTGFSHMKIEWENDVIGRVVKGLKGHVEYDETFYIALIKNYKEMGWLSEADDAYYTYRQEKRKRRGSIYGGVEFVFLEISFGYGVKSMIFLRSFLILCFLFGCFYMFFLRRKESWYRPCRCIRFLCRYGPSLVGWAVVHSLDNLTPGIDINSLSTMLLGRGVCVFSDKSKAVIVAESVQKLVGWYLLALFLMMFGRIWVR